MLFSCFIKKVNKRNKTEDRAIAVTAKAIFKLDPKHNFKIVKHGIPLDTVRLQEAPPEKPEKGSDKSD